MWKDASRAQDINKSADSSSENFASGFRQVEEVDALCNQTHSF